MAINVPSALWDKYYEACDFFINDDHIGRRCKLVFPPKNTACDNCTTSMVGASTHNAYKHGGPMPFSLGNCPLCGGSGYKQIESTDTVRLRIYWTKKDMARISPYTNISSINVPDSVVLVIGFLSDLPKIKQAAEIILVDENTHEEFRFTLEGEPYPHGFGKNRYFAVYLKRS